ALQQDGKAVIAGSFSSYNGVGRNCVARLNTDGSLDTAFDPQGGVDEFSGFIHAVALDSYDDPIIGGSFTSYNGSPANDIARLTNSGALDSSFGASVLGGTIWSLVTESDNKVIIGGDFTNVDGIPMNGVARLNPDGTLDSAFAQTNVLDGPVYSVALQPTTVSVTRSNTPGLTTPQEDDYTFNVGANAGRLSVSYDMESLTNELQVFYNGGLIYDTGPVTNAATFSLNVGPGPVNATSLLFIVNPGAAQPWGTNWMYSATFTTTVNSPVYIGGGFAHVDGYGFSGVARLANDGSLDTSFNPGLGANNTVYALGSLSDGSLILGGAFTAVNGFTYNHLAKLTPTGAVDASFMPGTGGADDNVYCILPQPDGTIYIGGSFQHFNGTLRRGFARLYANGTVDTTFMDSAYNQFAGFPRIFYSDPIPSIMSCAVQDDGNVIVGGTFNMVGGGEIDRNVKDNLDLAAGIQESFSDPNLYAEPKQRDGVRIRDNVARLTGGSTPGEGNLCLLPNGGTTYSADKSEQFLPVALLRTNGALGPLSANFSVQSGTAVNGQDYLYSAIPPYYGVSWQYLCCPDSRRHSDGLFGTNDFLQDIYGDYWHGGETLKSAVTVTILNDKNVAGDLSASFNLANPSGADQFYLGGEDIPLGDALGASSAPLTIIDDNKNAGTFGFARPQFIATNSSALIVLLRSNSIAGQTSVKYSTTNGTAIAGVDYTAIINHSTVFGSGVSSNGFYVTILGNSFIYTNTTEKYFKLNLTSLSPPVSYTAAYGISNAIVRIINPNWQGYLTLSATNYGAPLSSGAIAFTVNRISGSKGTITVKYATTNGTAVAGTDYIGATNTLTWNSGDSSARTVSIPLLPNETVGSNKQFGVYLFNPTLDGAPTNLFFQEITNATMTITNDNSYGALQFSQPSYSVNEDGGYATITVNRYGGAAGAVSVNFATSDGSNTTAGRNYGSTNGVLSFAPGQISTNFNVPIFDDGVQDPTPFYFNVSLSNPTNAALGAVSNAQVQIVDAQSYNQPPGSSDSTFYAAGMNGDVLALDLEPSGELLAGGNFTAVGSTPEGDIALLDTNGMLDTGFLNGLSGANGPVQAISLQSDGRVLIGGSFDKINSLYYRYGVARLMTDGSLDTSFDPGSGASGPVDAIAQTFIGTGTNVARKIYVGGNFVTFNSQNYSSLVRLNNNGSIDGSFNPGAGPDGAVLAIAVYPTNSPEAGKILIGGDFTHYNDTNVNYFARLDADGALDPTFSANFSAGADAKVHAIAIQNDGSILLGGNFSSFNGVGASHVVRLNPDGSVDANFVSNLGLGANANVEGMALQPDNRILLVGNFTLVNGVTRNRIARLLPTGATDPTINFGYGANGDVSAVLVQPADGKIVIGGAFTQFDNQPHNHIARLYGNSVTGSGAFEFSSAAYQAPENGPPAIITIRRTGGTSGTNAGGAGTIYVTFATSNGTAANGVNYQTVVTNVPFPVGEVLETVPVPVIDDSNVTPNLTVNLSLTNPTPPAVLGSQPTATLAIINEDSAVNFASAYYTVSKPSTNNPASGLANIAISRQGGGDEASSVQFSTTTNGTTAVAGTDYWPTNETVAFNPGDSTAYAQVQIISNNIPEGNRLVALVLSNAVGSLIYAPSNAILTIIDTVSSPGQISFDTGTDYVDENAGSITLNVIRLNGSSDQASFSYQTMDGTAVAYENYTPESGTLTFGVGQTNQTITIPILDDHVVDSPLNFSVALSNPTGGATLTAPSTANVTIINTDEGLIFAQATNVVSETASFATLNVLRLGSTSNSVSVNYATANGTALAGVNYVSSSGTLNFPDGAANVPISVPLIHDANVTGNLYFTVALSSPTSPAALGNPSTAVVDEIDAEAGVSFTNSDLTVPKNIGIAAIPVVATSTNLEPFSVSYFTQDGTALSNVNYLAQSGTLLFSNGVSTNLINIPIINNTRVDTASYAFNLVLTNATPPASVINPGAATVTIKESNAGLAFSQSIYTALKQTNVVATINVFRTGVTDNIVAVNYTATNGTAVPYQNYIPASGTLLFTNGQTDASFTVTVLDYPQVQSDLTVLLQLLSPSNSAVLLAPNAATLVIHDTTGSHVVPSGSALISGTTNGVPDTGGILDSNEVVNMLFGFRVDGGTNVADLKATLLATNGVAPSSPVTQDYGPLDYLGH
ncbi:MAG: hypothetical protein KGR98_02015, partial [Verrucomicrobia bacterium]|nr:hypothetical protein [Verrucomicrobiota bacterium]